MIFMGLNDFGWGFPPVPSEDASELPVFSVAYAAMLEKIRRRYPRAEIWCLTLPMGYKRRDPDFSPATCRAGWHISDYCRVIRNAAEKAGCRTVDITDPAKPYDALEGYHPTAEGMRTIADAVLAQLTHD